MEVRMLRKPELLPALHLVWEVFAEDISHTYTPEGVAEFQGFIKYENMLPQMLDGRILYFGAFEGGVMQGVLAAKREGHICLFYVKKGCQGKGIGRRLFTEAVSYFSKMPGMSRMTVNAAPGAADKYEHMGMKRLDAEQERNGIRYVPMEMVLYRQDMQYTSSYPQPEKGNTNTGLIIAGIIAGILLLTVFMIAGVMIVRTAYNRERNPFGNQAEQWDDDPMAPDSPLWDERDKYGDDGEGDSGSQPSNLSGSYSIPAYIADDLAYEIEEGSYTFTDTEKKSMIISFDVKYPDIQGLDAQTGAKINEEIKKCAMSTVDRIYENPSAEFKEKMLGIENPILASLVTYKVCYASNDFISIVFEETGAEGDPDESVQHLRTLNIGIKDGKVYQVKDIVNLDGKFAEEWLEAMRDEAGEVNFLAELDEDDMIKTLGGESIDGNYMVNFFVDEEGIEIGYDLNYVSGDPADLGYVWVTAPFTFEEIKPYQKDMEFWKFFG